ncbi:hypothetical protein HNY73_007024 [Argiope bruennichi]|uniref:Ubiquitin-like protease family profile domain-containing protein n=1 Tax=Argiope bruennichi TaxID=94029 RepID=A0A8T0FF44_ARGBR|nr:hypothetical protein HNY73_007024 [Argiope bruennichi]
MVREHQPSSSREPADQFISEFTFVEDTLDNRNYKVLLKQEDIVNIAKIEYGWCGEGGNVVFKVIGYEQFKIQLDHYKDILKEKQSLTFIINLNNYHWVTLVITYFQQQFSAYYIDSFGQELPYNISNTLKDEVKNIKDFKIKQHHWYNCGIFALENARVINEALQKSKDPIAAVLDLQLTDDLLKTIREEYARALSRRDKIENKFEVLIKFLERLNKQRLRMQEFNFQNVNILLFFLETLALQDPILQDSGCPDAKSKLWPYEQKLVDQGIIDLDDLKCVQYIRTNKIFHRDAYSEIKPADFKEIVNLKEVDGIKELFQELKKYAEQTYLKLKGEILHQSDCKKLTDLFENRNENVLIGNIITQKQLRKYILLFFKNATAKVCYENDRLNLQKANEIMFTFVVNVIPFIDLRYKKPAEPLGKIKWFRGDLLHTFYKFGDNYKLLGIELKDFMRKYAPYFFKYYYSLEVHSVLCKVGHHDARKIDKNLKGLMQKFQNEKNLSCC